MAITPTQEEFVRRFKAYMANAGAYKALSDYIKSLQSKGLRECLSIYFDVSKDYRGKDEHKRSVTVFYDVSLKAVKSSDVYFALRYEALVLRKDTDWQKAYAELDATQRRRLTSQISQQKTALSWVQRGFLNVFEQHMKKPNQKAVSEYTAKLKKSDQLFDCLRVYVEASQRAPDDDKESLIVFFGVSLQALWRGDFQFAATYESLVTSEGTIWKRRFDALDSWQRDEKLKPAIAEKKKITIETRGKIKVKDKDTGKEEEKEVVAQEKFTVPALSHVPPDLEGPRPSSPVSATQRDYVARFKQFMDSPNAKPALFTEYIFKLTGPQLVECVEAYLQASIEYGDNNERSLYIFFGTAALAIRKSDAYYAFKFESGIKAAGTLLAKRFGALNTEQTKALKRDIEIKRKQARILDDLKLAYFQKEKKEPTLQALREFDFVAKSDKFDLLSNALDGIDRAFNLYSADDFSKRFDALSALLVAKMEPLLYVSLLKRCREAKGIGPTLRHQLYWYMVGILYLQALQARPEVYKTGFSGEEKQFLFDAGDAGDPYFPDFAIRLDYLWLHTAGVAQFSQTCKGYMGLLLFAAKIGARLVPTVEMAVVRGVVEKLRKDKPQAIENIRIPINSRHDQGKTLRIYQTIGKIFILWWEPNLGAYIEHEGLDGVLFRVDSYDWLGQVYDNDAIWGEVYRRTAYILVVLPFIFEILGYLPDLVSGGITGLAKSIFINIAIEKTVDGLGLNANVVQLALLGAGLIAHHVSAGREGAAGSHLEGEFLESERGTAGRLTEDGGTRNKRIEPPPKELTGIGDQGVPDPRPLETFTEGTGANSKQIEPATKSASGPADRGVHDTPSLETLTQEADRKIDDRLGSAGGEHGGGAPAKPARPTDVPPPPNAPPATRADLARAEEQWKDAKERFNGASDTLEKAKDRVGDLEYLIEQSGGKGNPAKLKEQLAIAEKNVESARARFKERKYELRAAESRVERLTADLKQRGELQPSLRIEWNLPDKPTTFRYKSREEKSWRPDAYVGTSDNRQIVERLLNEDPNGELGKRLLQNGELFPANVGDMNYWKAHPELIEMAHVLSKREKGREVFVVMTKARNRIFSANLERTGGVFLEDAIVLQGIAIDRPSAVQMGVPQSVIDRAPVIKFSK